MEAFTGHETRANAAGDVAAHPEEVEDLCTACTASVKDYPYQYPEEYQQCGTGAVLL